MASLKPVLKNYTKDSGKSTIFIRISHDGKTRYVKSIYEIEPKFMNIDGSISSKYPGHAKLNLNLNLLMSEYNGILADIGRDIAYMNINTILSKLRKNESQGASFTRYIKQRIEKLTQEERFGYATHHMATLKWMKEFARHDEILFKEINKDFLEKFELYLDYAGKRVNTRRLYLNCIRTIFNLAIDDDTIKIALFPFRKFRIRSENPEKPSLTINEMKRLQMGPHLPGQMRAIEFFMLSFYLIGMNCKDMLYLSRNNIKRDRIVYKRSKTEHRVKEMLSVKIMPQVRALFEKYRGEKYLLNPLDKNDSYEHFKTVTHNFNTRLKSAAINCNIEEDLSMTYARHSWATIASALKISEDVISHAFGHLKNKTTNVYIDYDITQVDEANEMIIRAITL